MPMPAPALPPPLGLGSGPGPVQTHQWRRKRATVRALLSETLPLEEAAKLVRMIQTQLSSLSVKHCTFLVLKTDGTELLLVR